MQASDFKKPLGVVALAIATMAVVHFALREAAAGADSAAPALDVFVGYADSDRANAATFPAPWADASNPTLIFEGCQPAPECSYDAGAVRLVNNSDSSITINSIKVEYSSACVYDIWPRDVVLRSGRQVIVTQLRSGATDGCTNTTDPKASGYGLMDGSDITSPPGGVSCVPSGVVPQIGVTVNGKPTTFTDSGQVLNTGGVDKAYCPGNPNGTGVNESIQWTSVGSLPCTGAALSLGPAAQTDRRGAIATVSANFQNACGQPLQGSRVSFAVFGPRAPNAGQGGAVVTDPQGNAVFRYPDTTAGLGTDRVQASVSGPGGPLLSNVVSVNWVNEPPTSPSPVITKLSLRPIFFLAGPHSGLSIVTGSRPFGTIVSYRDSLSSITTFTVFRLLPGRKHRRGSCVQPTRRNRTAKPCVRRVLIGTFLHFDRGGINRFRFTGRVNGKPLSPGSYHLRVVSHNQGGAGPPISKAFRIIPRR
jgi:hypothetical protein